MGGANFLTVKPWIENPGSSIQSHGGRTVGIGIGNGIGIGPIR